MNKVFIDNHNDYQKEYYNETFKKTMLPSDSKYVKNQINHFLSESNLKTDSEILEIGCGMGKYSFHLLEEGFKITGLDLSPFLLDEFKKRNTNNFNINLINCDVLDVSNFTDLKYDDIIGFMVLHHLHNLEFSFSAMKKVLKPGGRLIFLEPNAWNPLYYLQIFFTPGMTWKSEKGVAKMKKNTLYKSLKNAGFRDIRIKRFGFFPPFIKNTKWGNYIDNKLSEVKFIEPILPFQIIIIE